MEQKHLNRLVETLGISDSSSLAKLVGDMIKMRDYVCQRNTIAKYELGDLVIDTRDRELGFVVGPFTMMSDSDTKTAIQRQAEQKGLMYLTVTYSNIDKRYRVRYVPNRFLEPIYLEPKESELRKSDFEKFCENQCIMDCSSECLLWKYKKKR